MPIGKIIYFGVLSLIMGTFWPVFVPLVLIALFFYGLGRILSADEKPEKGKKLRQAK